MPYGSNTTEGEPPRKRQKVQDPTSEAVFAGQDLPFLPGDAEDARMDADAGHNFGLGFDEPRTYLKQVYSRRVLRVSANRTRRRGLLRLSNALL